MDAFLDSLLTIPCAFQAILKFLLFVQKLDFCYWCNQKASFMGLPADPHSGKRVPSIMNVFRFVATYTPLNVHVSAQADIIILESTISSSIEGRRTLAFTVQSLTK